MRLPATLRYMVESHKHQISNFNLTGAHGPGEVAILFHWSVIVFLKRARETIIINDSRGRRLQ
jgi:hypothetical protein